MAPLSVDLRNQLARAIQDARREGQAGASSELRSLAVHLGKAHDSMEAPARTLRGRLRAHGKQLGDARDPVRDTQEIDRLAHEVAYEHWHRMLFARFLAENNLLIEPTHCVAISMEECEELAREQGVNPWALAASYAQAMLPEIFRVDDPVLDVQLPPETRLTLERILQPLPSLVFTADDSLGWTYQFWQTEKKDEVNRSGVKIGAEELPAVTQLFTEHYMVLFLFHNTIGAWRAGKILAANPELARHARDEEELRRAVRLSAQGGYEFSYLRFVHDRVDGDLDDAPSGPWRPAAGTFDGWPTHAAELRVLDPCCGSGHFLVEGFELLVRLRMDEEGVSAARAVQAVLADNLFGLEIDARCTQIAAFNVALAAWKLLGKSIDLPPLNIACSGTAISSTRDEWMGLLQDGGDTQIRFFFGELHKLFEKGPVLGSLINPRLLAEGRLSAKGMEGLLKSLAAAALSDAPERHELGVAARGLARAAELLADRYTLVITNVPYLGRGNQGEHLKKHLEDHYAAGKFDLATAFALRGLSFCEESATLAQVTQRSWLFQTTYARLRERLLVTSRWHFLAELGPGAFETISGEKVSVALLVQSAKVPDAEQAIVGIDVSTQRGDRPIPLVEKAALLAGGTGASLNRVMQAALLDNPDARITFRPLAKLPLLGSVATAQQGVKTGDDDRFRRFYWEVALPGWPFMQTTVKTSMPWGGLLYRVDARRGESAWARPQGRGVWGRSGVAVSQMSDLPVAMYSGAVFDSNMTPLVPREPRDVAALWCFANDVAFREAIGSLDKSLKVPNGAFERVPFDRDLWREAAAQRFPDGPPLPETDDPTQWLFHGRPESATSPLQVAVARVVGHRWPTELDPGIRLSDRSRGLVDRCGELSEFANNDGVVCLSSVRGEKPAADRLLALLSACDLKPNRDLDDWLRNEFFEEHCKLFHNHPFIWHIWDGRSDGFHALVNYHKLASPNAEGRRTLEALTYSYLGDWIQRQKADQQEGKDGADARLAAAQDLQAQLERILLGEPPYDIFVRWKPFQEQPIGWDPDINDGVRVNIRPFMSVELRKGGRPGAGLLRWKPNIDWKRDHRGSDVESMRPIEEFPWCWGCPGEGSIDERTNFKGGAEFDGRRWNDLHYTNAMKQAARVRAAVGRQ